MNPGWPTRTGWWVALVLALYVLCMHSTFFSERQTQWAQWEVKAHDIVTDHLKELQQQMTELHSALGQTEHNLQRLSRDADVLKRYTCP